MNSKKILAIFLIIISFLVGWFSTGGQKSQLIRILDVIVFGPILIYSALYIDDPWLYIILLFLGASTMGYNLRNYREKT